MTADQRRELIETVATELFAEHGYHGCGVEQIAGRAGVSVPVLYDHFPSKTELYRRLLEKHFADLRAIWGAHAPRLGDSRGRQLAAALDAWFAYVEAHPYAGRMLFRDTTGDPHIERAHKEIQTQSREALLPLIPLRDRVDVELAWEVLRGVLQGLALWWYEHPGVPRAKVVKAALDAVWTGYERRIT